MHLIIFDIDGTITDSVDTDYHCFTESLNEVFKLGVDQVAWDEFPHMTDAALIHDIIREYLEKKPSPQDVELFQVNFFSKLHEKVSQMPPFQGIFDLWTHLADDTEVALGIATGCWKTSGALKLNGAGIDMEQYPHGTSDDHHIRTEIIRQTIKKACEKHMVTAFDRTTYVGDGLWDFRAAKSLGIDFIGVDQKQKGTFDQVSLPNVIWDYTQRDQINLLLSNE